MTTKPRVQKFRVRRAPLGAPRPAGEADAAPRSLVLREPAAAGTPAGARDPASAGALAVAPGDDEALRAEGLTGRQLRLARRVAQKHGIQAATDFDAVRELRARGIDPFQASTLLELVQGAPAEGAAAAPAAPATQAPSVAASLPARAARATPAPPVPDRPAPDRTTADRAALDRAAGAERRASEVARIQRDIGRRRRRRLLLLLARLAVFVILPTVAAGWYFARVATPMFATRSEFVIQQAEGGGAASGLGGLFQGTSMATQQDSMTVQAYLTSRAALLRLDAEHGFRDHFADPAIDPVQRLPAGATAEDAYALYRDHVKIAYDPTEGIVKMEVIAADPATSQAFSEALIGYAEDQVDQLTQRLRGDQMAGARASYEEAEGRRAAALAELLRLQQDLRQIDPVGETAARTAQISALETERQQLDLDLRARLAVPRPNEAQVEALQGQVTSIEALIADLRADMTQGGEAGASLAARNTELRIAEENYGFQAVQVQAALAQMEAARIEANRQVRYLSLGVEPVAPDEATYPRAFENTVLAFLILAGLYLLASLTASILREQVTS